MLFQKVSHHHWWPAVGQWSLAAGSWRTMLLFKPSSHQPSTRWALTGIIGFYFFSSSLINESCAGGESCHPLCLRFENQYKSTQWKVGRFTCASILILSPSIDCHQVENAQYHHLFLDSDLVGENRYCMWSPNKDCPKWSNVSWHPSSRQILEVTKKVCRKWSSVSQHWPCHPRKACKKRYKHCLK